MSEEERRSKARIPTAKISEEQREMLSSAIMNGLINPGSFTINNPLATEGGDYDQNGGPYTQSGGGNHNQGGGGGYNQSSLTDFTTQPDVTRLDDIVRLVDRFRR